MIRAAWTGSPAENVFREVLAAQRRTLGDDHPSVALCSLNLAFAIEKQGRYAESFPYYSQVLKQTETSLGRQHKFVHIALVRMAAVLSHLKDDAAAEPIWREAIELWKSNLTPDDPRYWRIADTQNALGGSLIALGRYEEADAILLESRRALHTAENVPDNIKPEALRRIIKLYEHWGKPDKAAEYRAMLAVDDDSNAAGVAP